MDPRQPECMKLLLIKPNALANGSVVPVGAPTGAGEFLTLRLTGSVRAIESLAG